MDAEGERARLLGWMAGMRMALMLDPYARPGWRPAEHLVEGLVRTWASWHYGRGW